MFINFARLEGDDLILNLKDVSEAYGFVSKFKPAEYDVKRKYDKRSVNANDLCWALCEEIAKAVGITKYEVYQRNIRQAGVFADLAIREDLIGAFSRKWMARGTGWFIEVVDDEKVKGYKKVFAYFGSSSYTTQEMARLIDNIFEDARSVGIEVLNNNEKSLLLEDWGRRK